MSNFFVDGFGLYGTGTGALVNMLAGTWAAMDLVNASCEITTLPWDSSNPDLYFRYGDATPARYAFPGGATDPVRMSVYFAAQTLPSGGTNIPFSFNDGSNTPICYLSLSTTGALQLFNNSNTLLASTNGPVITAETATHLEMELNRSAGTFNLYVNEVLAMSGSSLTFTGSGGAQQIAVGAAVFAGSVACYYAHMILRNSSGSYNNTFPVGDRKVATLLVNNDISGHQGWAGEPRHLFALGLEDNRNANNTGVTAASSTQTDLGSGDFTIEGFFRFSALPTGSAKAVMFGKWDETNNRRSYQLYTGGPSLESGNTVFRTSTDGTAGTVVEDFSYPWAPQTDTWYHVAVVRSSSSVLFFVNGVQLGLSVSDSATYFVGTETTALGVQDDSGTQIANTAFNGFIGQFRLTVGFARYTSNFTAPSAEFPIGSGADPHWSNVQWVSNWDTGLFDQSAAARTLTAKNGAVFLTPNDGSFNYQCLGKATPFDDTNIQAALTAATAILTETQNVSNGQTVTVGTYTFSGSHTAVYTWKTVLANPFDVLIGANTAASLSNLIAAINGGAGGGTLYGNGSGYAVNNDVTGSALPGTTAAQMLVTANTPGTAGNSVACSTTDTHGSWSGATLSGGANIPAYSQFGYQRLPITATLVDSITLVHRDFKTDAGTCTVQASFVGAAGGVGAGTSRPVTTTPILYADVFESDPDTGAGITPTTVIGGAIKLNRTA